MTRKRIASGPSHDRKIHKELEGKTICKIDTETKEKEVHVTFTDGTVLEVVNPHLYAGLHCDLYEYLPAQTKLSFTAWREYRQFDGKLVECFEQFFRAFGNEVLESKLTGTDDTCHDWNFYHWGQLRSRVIEDLAAGLELQKFGRLRDTNQFLLEWDFEGTNQREQLDILLARSFWVLGCDVSYDTPVLSARIYLLPADRVNAAEKMTKRY